MPVRLPSFWLKSALAVGVVAAGDLLLFETGPPGISLGFTCLALVAALALANPAVRASRLGGSALLAATAFALLQLERPTLVGWLLFTLAVALAALAPRASPVDDVWRWAQRLVMAGLKSLLGPARDLRRILKVRARSGPVRFTDLLLAAILPVGGGAVFIGLFATANPIIEQAFSAIHLPQADPGRLVFWIVLAFPVWAALRPRGLRRTLPTPGMQGELDLPSAVTGSVAAALVVFNLLFAIQNGLDLAFLWSGAPLPGGVKMKDYVHRGAYPLIATTLLAGLFVLVFLRPGSATAASAWCRRLVTLWVAQNLILVASCVWRTLDYIHDYLLTRLRVAALAWMALVAVGLVLICWRMWRNKSAGWLINANALAACAVLVASSLVDLGAIAAAWNVRHSRELGGAGQPLDLCYLRRLDGAALVSLAELELKPLPPHLRERVVWTRRVMTAEAAERQSHWRSWRWRDARRLARVEALVGPDTLPPPNADERGCAGKPEPPPRPPLTATPQPGT